MERKRGKGGKVRPRPALFRALGREEPPSEIVIGGAGYRRLKTYKHDSYAATALYEGEEGRVVAKFNRQQPILGLPMKWLGRLLARREERALQRLRGEEGIAAPCGEIWSGGRPLSHAVAHEYIDGHPLGRNERVGDDFFPRLGAALAAVHSRDMAFVDLHKRENIIVGEDGSPWLIDFQIHYALPAWWPAKAGPARVLLRVLQGSDEYHLRKHMVRLRPDLLGPGEADLDRLRPWWIRCWRLLSAPFQFFRRRLLVAIGVRSGAGKRDTEYDPEEAVRLEERKRDCDT